MSIFSSIGNWNPLIGGAAISAGTGLLGGAFSYLANRGAYNRAKQDYAQSKHALQGELGKDVINSKQLLGLSDAAAVPKLRQAGSAMQRATGNINAGDAQGALWERMQADRINQFRQWMEQNAQLKSQRDVGIKSQLFGAAGQNLRMF